jgi:hypothetical protein
MAAPRFQNDDEAAQHYLSTLRDGTRDEKIVARDGLAAIFARRGLYEEAAELYELNVRAGVRTPEIFESLAEVYRKLGDEESAQAAFAEADRWRPDRAPSRVHAAEPPAPAPPSSTGDPGADVRAERPPEPPPAADESRLVPFPGAPTRDGGTARVTAESPGLSSGSRTAGPARSARRVSAAPALAPEVELDPDSEVTRRLAVHPLPGEPDQPDQPVGRLSRVPGPIQVVGIVVLLIAVPVMLLAVLVVNPLALYLEGRAAGPIVDAHATDAPQLKIAAGATSAWYLDVGRSVSGLWATSGLEMTLDQAPPDSNGSGQTFVVTAPRPQSWGETITIVERRGQGRANQEMLVPAQLDAPSSLPPAGTVMTGHIAGQVTAPRLSESSQFNTVSERIDMPVRLVVVSMPALLLDRFSHAVEMYFDEDRWLLVTIGALLTWCVVAGGTAILFRFGQR